MINGGAIGFNNFPTNSGTKGIWTLKSQYVVSRAGFWNAVPPISIQYLIVGGGASGWLGHSHGGAGGQTLSGSVDATPELNYSVSIGAGGAGPASGGTVYEGTSGNTSVAVGISAIGGNGLEGTGPPPDFAVRGSRGLGAAGLESSPGNIARNGGDGTYAASFTMAGAPSGWYGGGGGAAGGNGYETSPGGTGGQGGGGTGGTGYAQPPTVAAANTGGGGSGGGISWCGSIYCGGVRTNGGSGIVILKYPAAKNITVGAGLTSSTVVVSTDKVTTITAGTGNVSFA
jgi:hypothetical protein